ncbi:MAG: anhydro-N-acetylmuramic acid kinase [Bacteroidales bacterium]|nr:anhydro-N-acetylmuramic acid kinase [Bacteroidales bacterium]MBN2764218.1 anhydro-N-acetylmuramic acid kinase [Bacteroidales bacterium]
MDHSASNYHALGVMSGTSLDGLDLALCHFSLSDGQWSYAIHKAVTLPYPDSWQQRLKNAPSLDGLSLLLLHKEYGRYIGEQINAFLSGSNERPDLIASHGHTVFHMPENGLTFQLGDGAVLASSCNMTTITDFRSFDVALGGQGAPLVPIGDEMLFGDYDYCLNLGGFANISYHKGNKRIAFDICPVNILINDLSQKLGLQFDKNGHIGRSGKVINEILSALDALAFYSAPPPKSLSREWVEQHVLPLITSSSYAVPDLIRTVCLHIARQITANIDNDPSKKILVTGGGTYNTLLMELLRDNTSSEFVIPEDNVIQYKEALIFALLGILRMRNETNCLASVTGARKDSSSGIVFFYDPPR